MGLLLRPFWGNNVETNTSLATFSIGLTIIFLPMYLLSINYYFAKKHRAEQFISNGLVIISCVLISAQINFYNWANSIGSHGNPDGGTEAVISLERWGGSIICIIGTIIGHYRLTHKNKNTNVDT